jgi:hypothetical protein
MLFARKFAGQSQGGLCDQCGKISLNDVRAASGYLLHPNVNALVASATTCQLCGLVEHHLRNAINTFKQLGGDLRLHTVSLERHVDNDKVWIRAMGLKLGQLHIYAHPG